MEAILSVIDRVDPILVGLSLIFQFYVHRFEALARYLREHGVSAHFTMGGHFPSLSPEETLALVPQLDSVVRFEGELTLLELVDRLGLGLDWRATDGLVYRAGDQVVETPARPLLADLDELPHPHRAVDTRQILGRTCAQLVASRGCARTCSFCSIHMFYRTAPGKVVRTRRPAEVAREMRMLYEDLGATVLLFQDDDFPIFGPVWHRWCRELLDEIDRQDLVGRVLWKINCRVDAVDPALFADMRDAGLYLAYLGLESGSDVGLRTLNKGITVEQNIRAVEILKDLAIRFDFGFMMLDPSSTFESVLENVAFLRTIVGDGSSPAEFCRMVPYDGTPIKEELGAGGPPPGRRVEPRLRLPRPPPGGVLQGGERGAQCHRVDPRSRGALAAAEVRLERTRDHGAADARAPGAEHLSFDIAVDHARQQRRAVRDRGAACPGLPRPSTVVDLSVRPRIPVSDIRRLARPAAQRVRAVEPDKRCCERSTKSRGVRYRRDGHASRLP